MNSSEKKNFNYLPLEQQIVNFCQRYMIDFKVGHPKSSYLLFLLVHTTDSLSRKNLTLLFWRGVPGHLILINYWFQIIVRKTNKNKDILISFTYASSKTIMLHI